MISLTPIQTTSISNYLVMSSLLKDTFGTSNNQLQTIDSYLTGTNTATNSTTGGSNDTGSSIAATSNAEASSLLGAFLNTVI